MTRWPLVENDLKRSGLRFVVSILTKRHYYAPKDSGEEAWSQNFYCYAHPLDERDPRRLTFYIGPIGVTAAIGSFVQYVCEEGIEYVHALTKWLSPTELDVGKYDV